MDGYILKPVRMSIYQEHLGNVLRKKAKSTENATIQVDDPGNANICEGVPLNKH
jgi:hypothetical protein